MDRNQHYPRNYWKINQANLLRWRNHPDIYIRTVNHQQQLGDLQDCVSQRQDLD